MEPPTKFFHYWKTKFLQLASFLYAVKGENLKLKVYQCSGKKKAFGSLVLKSSIPYCRASTTQRPNKPRITVLDMGITDPELIWTMYKEYWPMGPEDQTKTNLVQIGLHQFWPVWFLWTEVDHFYFPIFSLSLPPLRTCLWLMKSIKQTTIHISEIFHFENINC